MGLELTILKNGIKPVVNSTLKPDISYKIGRADTSLREVIGTITVHNEDKTGRVVAIESPNDSRAAIASREHGLLSNVNGRWYYNDTSATSKSDNLANVNSYGSLVVKLFSGTEYAANPIGEAYFLGVHKGQQVRIKYDVIYTGEEMMSKGLPNHLLKEVSREYSPLADVKNLTKEKLPELGVEVGHDTLVYFAPVTVQDGSRVTTLADRNGEFKLTVFQKQFDAAPYHLKFEAEEQKGDLQEEDPAEKEPSLVSCIVAAASNFWGRMSR